MTIIQKKKNESEDSFSDLEILDKRKIKKKRKEY